MIERRRRTFTAPCTDVHPDVLTTLMLPVVAAAVAGGLWLLVQPYRWLIEVLL